MLWSLPLNQSWVIFSTVLLNGPGHGDVALHVHAAHHHVGARLLHALHIGGHRGARIADLEVGVDDLVPVGRQGLGPGLAGGRRGGDAVGDEGDLGRLGLLRHVAHERPLSRVVLHRAPRGEQVGRAGPVARDVVAVGRGARLDEEVRREERGRHAGDGEHVVLVDQGVGQLVEGGRVPAVVQLVLVVDLAAVHAALGVDVLVVGLLAVDQRAEVGGQRAGLGRDRPHRDGIRRHPRRAAPEARRFRCPRVRRPARSPPDHRPNTVATSALIPCLTRIPSPFAPLRASPRGCRSLYFRPFMWSLHPLCQRFAVSERPPCRSLSPLGNLVSLRGTRSRLSVHSPLSRRTSIDQSRNNRWRSKSRKACTSFLRIAGSSSTRRATSGS